MFLITGTIINGLIFLNKLYALSHIIKNHFNELADARLTQNLVLYPSSPNVYLYIDVFISQMPDEEYVVHLHCHVAYPKQLLKLLANVAVTTYLVTEEGLNDSLPCNTTIIQEVNDLFIRPSTSAKQFLKHQRNAVISHKLMTS